MIITDNIINRNVGEIGVHAPKSKLQIQSNLYISNSKNELMMRMFIELQLRMKIG